MDGSAEKFLQSSRGREPRRVYGGGLPNSGKTEQARTRERQLFHAAGAQVKALSAAQVEAKGRGKRGWRTPRGERPRG